MTTTDPDINSQLEANAVKQAHLNQASTHLLDAIANIQSAVYAAPPIPNSSHWTAENQQHLSEELIAPLKGVLAECTAEVVFLQRQFAQISGAR